MLSEQPHKLAFWALVWSWPPSSPSLCWARPEPGTHQQPAQPHAENISLNISITHKNNLNSDNNGINILLYAWFPHQDTSSFGDQLSRGWQLWQVHAGQQPVQPRMAAHPLAEVRHEGKRILPKATETFQIVSNKPFKEIKRIRLKNKNSTCSWRYALKTIK